ncbi:NAD(P)-binding protein [Nocardia nova]|uniref:NAD(P)-binding protein n=1 Tax=Nocardia nova TaxID=37330 RepID=UPI00192C80DB
MVIGSGIGGLAAAHALARRSWQITVVAQAPNSPKSAPASRSAQQREGATRPQRLRTTRDHRVPPRSPRDALRPIRAAHLFRIDLTRAAETCWSATYLPALHLHFVDYAPPPQRPRSSVECRRSTRPTYLRTALRHFGNAREGRRRGADRIRIGRGLLDRPASSTLAAYRGTHEKQRSVQRPLQGVDGQRASDIGRVGVSQTVHLFTTYRSCLELSRAGSRPDRALTQRTCRLPPCHAGAHAVPRIRHAIAIPPADHTPDSQSFSSRTGSATSHREPTPHPSELPMPHP